MKKCVPQTNDTEYPRFSFRTTQELAERVRALKRQGLKPSQVINACLNNYLAVLEDRNGIVRKAA